MNEKGFTLVELLAALSILAILVIIAVPAFNTVNNQTRSASLENRKKAITQAMLNYANKYLIDEIKPENKTCTYSADNGYECCETFSINYMILNGIYFSGLNNNAEVNPITNKNLEGYVAVYYDSSKFALDAKFVMKEEDDDVNKQNLENISPACANKIND
jgi:prepilin-type N-terminal cleavage/methylation domain-containing protein